jgi:type IV secretory pathway TrbD component
MSLLVVLAALALLLGAALHISLPVFLAASAGIAVWLLAFGARESIARAKRR